jgi:hypothetical protein
MKKVFIGGSRRLFHLYKEIQRRLETLMEEQAVILIGDANGADKAVQRYFLNRGYDKIQIFCMAGNCRNNIGNWEVKEVTGPKGKKDFSYHALKDQKMADEASNGLMLWDGKSKGALANVYRLIKQGKPVEVYHAAHKEIITLTDKKSWDHFLLQCPNELKELVLGLEKTEKKKSSPGRQLEMF